MEAPRPPDPLQNGEPLLSCISILDRLIKTCPVWLQLCMGAQQVVEMLCREAAGVFLVTRDVDAGCMVLWVRSSEAAELLHYNIREEKTSKSLNALCCFHQKGQERYGYIVTQDQESAGAVLQRLS
ncbi:unnamed protein product [Ranitomeya imitator]|uniref:Uncharacterized protein n=1 Tax=Ranitomeya imitator TaxID=111125 RepID=A0ABN9LWV9_9NEOB|nr:unnamed protein product [Ranitomeya imitator]